MTQGRFLETCTSMQENTAQIVLDETQPKQTTFRLVDLPGHEKLRFKLGEYLDSAKGILFVVDSSKIRRDDTVRAAAELLYDILSDPVAVDGDLPMLVLCNKSDELLALSPGQIRKQLEAEINEIRKTRGAGIVSQSGDVGGEEEGTAFLGFEGEAFKFEHVPNAVTFVSVSSKDDEDDGEDDEDNAGRGRRMRVFDAVRDAVGGW
nr:hypothetical protein HK105_004842 [Polyrhizophydium stewartii]